MSLPKIDAPLFDLTIPSTKKEVKFRPFTVKEEKVLLIAKESKDIKQVIDSIKQIINNCLIGDVDVEKLALFDLEYLLLQIRAKSVDDIVDFTIRDPETNEEIELTLDIDKMKIEDTDQSKEIKVDDKVTLFMRYPSFSELEKIVEAQTNQLLLFDVLIDCIDYVVSEDQIYYLRDFEQTEIIEFAESLSPKTIESIKKFFENIPKLRYDIPYRNSKGEDKIFVIEGTDSFFI